MSDNILILHPRNAHAVFEDIPTLINELKNAGFLGENKEIGEIRREEGKYYFKPGEHFFELVKFQSSHKVLIIDGPNISPEEAEVVDSKTQVYISISKPTEKVYYLGGFFFYKASCPKCGYQYELEFLSSWFEKNKFMLSENCPQCGEEFFINDLDWQMRAGFGRQEIEIWGIHKDEAVPTERLLKLLKEITQIEWRYFFYRF